MTADDRVWVWIVYVVMLNKNFMRRRKVRQKCFWGLLRYDIVEETLDNGLDRWTIGTEHDKLGWQFYSKSLKAFVVILISRVEPYCTPAMKNSGVNRDEHRHEPTT